MNLFVRYFDNERVCHNMEEVATFLAELKEITINDADLESIQKYYDSKNLYPFRLKVSQNNYVLCLKTSAEDIEQFKEEREERGVRGVREVKDDGKKVFADFINEEHNGWYEATILFKRVVKIQGTSKCQYKDTVFKAQLKANSGADCYKRMIEHLRNRQDVDVRSRFPSIKSNNFEFEFLGDAPTVTV